jgi:hypothetical protein
VRGADHGRWSQPQRISLDRRRRAHAREGYVARLWRDGQATTVTARKAFSTRERAVEWATSYRGGEPSIAPSLLAAFAFLFGFIVTATLIGAVVGGREV